MCCTICPCCLFQFSSVTQSWPAVAHGLQHARLPYPSPAPGAYSNSCPWRRWCHPTISSSVVPFSSRLLSCPISGSFPMNWFFISGGQSTGVSASASVHPLLLVYFMHRSLPPWSSIPILSLSLLIIPVCPLYLWVCFCFVMFICFIF